MPFAHHDLQQKCFQPAGTGLDAAGTWRSNAVLHTSLAKARLAKVVLRHLA